MQQATPAVHLCECGCGRPTKIATETDTRTGAITGFPRRFVVGHSDDRHGRYVSNGQRFGWGVVVDPEIRIVQPNGSRRRGARLRCNCGNLYETLIDRLLSGDRVSCGCKQAGRARPASSSGGMSAHPLYKTWDGIFERCENPRSVSYPNYGARGISICDSWRDARVFIAYVEKELGARPEGCTIDRIDNDGDYEPGNVRWATQAEQLANRRSPDQWKPRRPRTPSPPRPETCARCGITFETTSMRRGPRFCSSACKQAARKASGDYDVERTCHQCGSTFTINRYIPTIHCSRSCGRTCSWAGGCPQP